MKPKSAVNEKYTWDLQDILGEISIEELIKQYHYEQQELLKIFKNDPFSSLENILKFHQQELKIGVLDNKVSNFLHNNSNVDLENSQWFFLINELQNNSIEFIQAISTWEDEVIKNKEKIKEYLKDPKFQKFSRYYENFLRYENHKLSPEIKKYIATYTQLDSSFSSLFSLIFDKELKVDSALDSKNKLHTIHNYSDYQSYLSNTDRTLRQNAYINWNNAIHHLRESFARLMYYNFLELNIDAKNHNFPGGYYESSIYDDELPKEFLPFIYEKVSAWSGFVKKYRFISKKIMQYNYSIPKLKPWDGNMPLFNEKMFFSVEKAQEIILSGLEVLGPEYLKIVKQAFDEKWIHWMPQKNKVSGAYCISGSYGMKKKYILLNFNNQFEDILTAAHELGHAVHAVKFCETQDVYAWTTIFIAEIPSILNEILLNYHFLKKYQGLNNQKKQLEVYDSMISSFIATTSTQLGFSEWEFDINNRVLQGQAIDASISEEIYNEKLKKYMGIKDKKDKLFLTSLTKILTVPHFYSGNFYVYKYAVGKIVALLTAEMLMDPSTQKQTLENLNKFLSSGASKSNLETVKLLGIDLMNPETWSKVEKILESWIQQYAELYKDLYDKKIVKK